jgi:folate-binding protein YgfZ
MSEAAETKIARMSPLMPAHQQHGAHFEERGGWLVPTFYSDARAEYAAVRGGGAGIIDLTPGGRIAVEGADAVQFLNGFVTNDIKSLGEDAWLSAAFPNAQGRLTAFARILRRGHRFLIETAAATRERIFGHLARFTLAGDFRVEDVTDLTATISVQGAQAAGVVEKALGVEAARVGRGLVAYAAWQGTSVTAIRATHTAEDGFDLFVDAPAAASLWAALATAGARPVGDDALDVLRIEAGIPRYGVDMDESNVVLESVPDDAVSFTKGCYLGQEIIARIHWRGHVARKLAGLSFDGEARAARGARIQSADGKEIGRATSVIMSPRLNRTIALAYVKYDYLAPGTVVTVLTDEGARRAAVTTLPFVRGSWYEPGSAAE